MRSRDVVTVQVEAHAETQRHEGRTSLLDVPNCASLVLLCAFTTLRELSFSCVVFATWHQLILCRGRTLASPIGFGSNAHSTSPPRTMRRWSYGKTDGLRQGLPPDQRAFSWTRSMPQQHWPARCRMLTLALSIATTSNACRTLLAWGLDHHRRQPLSQSAPFALPA
jgi:hypothetical protein